MTDLAGLVFALVLIPSASAAEMSQGEIAGVALGSIGGALILLGCLFSCYRVTRARQTGDLTWVKSGDLEAMRAAEHNTPHEPLPDASTYEQQITAAAVAHGVTCSANVQEIPAASMIMSQTQPQNELDAKQRSGERAHGIKDAVNKLLGGPKNLLRHLKGGPESQLEVSLSKRVEPSAELEMAGPFEPAASNMGPPMSKSSMLMRWLEAADDGGQVAAAQLMAAADNCPHVGGSPGGRLASVHSVRGGGRRGSSVGPFGDRLPLLSLAAQQSGIVWSKMPPSVASSPAVSFAETSSMFMLRGSGGVVKRSDENTTLTGSAAAEWHHGGDDRYPASLALASVKALKQRNSQGQAPSGVVFDHVSITPANSRSQTAGGAPSRAVTLGGAVLPTPEQADGGSKLGSARRSVRSAGGSLSFRASQGGVESMRCDNVRQDSLTAEHGTEASLDSERSFMGRLPDEHILSKAAQVLLPVSTSASETLMPRSSAAWRHQTLPFRLTSLRENEEEESPAACGTVPALPCSTQTSPPHMHTPALPTMFMRGQQQLEEASEAAVVSSPRPSSRSRLPSDLGGATAASDAAERPALPHSRSEWIRFTYGDSGEGSLQLADGNPSADVALPIGPDAASPYTHHDRTTPAGKPSIASPQSPFLPQPPSGGGNAVGDVVTYGAPCSVTGYGTVSNEISEPTHCPANRATNGVGGIVDEGIEAKKLAGVSLPEPHRYTHPTLTATVASKPSNATRSPTLATPPVRTHAVVPSPGGLRLSQSSSWQSHSSAVSPSLGIHYPDLTNGWGMGSEVNGLNSRAAVEALVLGEETQVSPRLPQLPQLPSMPVSSAAGLAAAGRGSV